MEGILRSPDKTKSRKAQFGLLVMPSKFVSHLCLSEHWPTSASLKIEMFVCKTKKIIGYLNIMLESFDTLKIRKMVFTSMLKSIQ